jgi:hypothetical protein
MPVVLWNNRQWKWIQVAMDALTGYTHISRAFVRTQAGVEDKRPAREWAWMAFTNFIEAVENEMNAPAGSFHPVVVVRDAGSDYTSAYFQTRINALATAHPNRYIQTVTPNAPGRSQFNFVERQHKTVRRMIYARKQRHDRLGLPGQYTWASDEELEWLNENINNYKIQPIKTTGRKAITQDGVTFAELEERRRQVAVKRYGSRDIQPLVGFSKGEEFLQEDDLVRLLQYKAGTVGSLSWNTVTKTAANTFSDIVYFVKRVHPGAPPMQRETYTIAPVNTPDSARRSRFTREQLLKIPGQFIRAPPDSDEEEDDDDSDIDSDDDGGPPAPPILPRPQTPGQQHRYSVGDVLRISRPLSNAVPGNVPFRDGTVTALTVCDKDGTQIATYRLRFTLANGQTRTIIYPAKNPEDDDDDNIDRSQYVQYLHS